MSREKGYGVPSLADGPSYGTLCINVKKIRWLSPFFPYTVHLESYQTTKCVTGLRANEIMARIGYAPPPQPNSFSSVEFIL